MIEILNNSASEFCAWLQKHLPNLGPAWWDENVVQRLTFQQQRSVQAQRITNLQGLDLAALLRVLDQNWHELAAYIHLPKEARTWLKELQAVRNRWAHTPSGGLPPQDAFRDADTLSRVLQVIGASDEVFSAVERYKQLALVRIAPSPQQPTSSKPSPAADATPKFAAGQLVRLRSNAAAIFPILEVLSSAAGETRYRVFENGVRNVYYESQLKAFEESSPERKVLEKTELSALLTAIQLASPSASALYSFNSGRIEFVPYQYRPVFKLIRADQPRLLVADEVGVGKTIEAGLILKELQARSDVKSVLIICPKPLVAERKWELEMKRFDEHFSPLDGRLLRHCINETHLDGEWPLQHSKAILPFSLVDADLLFGRQGRGRARDIGLLELGPPPRFDLVIVDEAHHIRNTETLLHQAVRYFCDHAEAVVFLSATPVQLGREDLFTLLNTLRPDLIIDQASFNQMAEPNRPINEAIRVCRRGKEGWADEVRGSLQEVAETDWGRNVLSINPGFQHIYDALGADAGDGISRIKTIQALEDLYTFSSLINRTRRRDIGDFTIRKPETVTTEFTDGQKKLHDDLLDVIQRILLRLHGNVNVRFMMTTISRQAASSLYGLAPLLEDMLNGKLDRLEALELSDADDQNIDFDFLDAVSEDIRSLITRVKTLDEPDPKAEAFVKLVKDKQSLPNNKVLAFSTFRHTLDYLVKKLDAAGVRYGLVHGGVPDEERAELRRRFRLSQDLEEAIDILLSSEVGCEGLDFQFCDCLINYDLPWNPMRIEQRIGRIDRYGQQSPTVAIFNLVTPGTIDADIYNRCLMRIGVFQHAIGSSEEILGEITKEIHSISESFKLTDDERAERLQQLADNKIRQIQEEQQLEEKQGELFGLNLPATSWADKLNQARSYWLEPEALARAASTYLTRRLGKEQEYLLGDKALKTLRINQDGRNHLLEDFRKLPKSNDISFRNWERWLKGNVPTLTVTFDQGCAVESPSAVLLSLGHPLLRQAAQFLQEPETVYTALMVEDPEIPPGDYPFAVYRWLRQGMKQDEELVAVATEAKVSENLFDLLKTLSPGSQNSLPEQEVFDDLDALHHRRWLEAIAEHAEANRQLVGARVQSLTASHQARRTLLEGQLRKASNEKIRIMKRAELDRAEADFARRIVKLQQATEHADIRATPAIFGVLEVRRPK